MPRIRTGYSFRNAVGSIENTLDRLIDCEYPVAPITDRASTFGWVRWEKAAKKKNIRPIFGIELGVTNSVHAKKPIVDYWTFISKDNLTPLHHLFEIATSQFRYEPLVTIEQAIRFSSDLMVIVGYRAQLDLFKPSENLWIGLGPSTFKGYIKKAKEAGFKFVAVSDNKYPTKTDAQLYEVICGSGASSQIYDQHIQTKEEWLNSIAKIGLDKSEIHSAWNARDYIFNNSTAQLKKATLPIPEKTKTLLDMCIEGARKLNVDLENPSYKERLNHELTIIKKKNFEDYFYIVADLIQWARTKMVVGPGRGSSCGSLVCFLLSITVIDPIPFGLIFERFIDIHRDDLPDIDIDFPEKQRHLVVEYLSNKYGKNHVAQLGTVALYKSKSAISEAGAALKIPKWECEAVVNAIEKKAAGDSRALHTIEDVFKNTEAGQVFLKKYPEMKIATKIEGHPRHYSRHAAGVIITKEPINHYVAIDSRTDSTQCDKKDAEDLDLLKIDALVVSQLSVIEETLDAIGMDKNDINNISLKDQRAFDVLNDKKFSGIFQFNGSTLQSIVKDFKVTEFKDIVSVTALSRPGPLSSAGEWVKRKNGESKIVYPHETFRPYLNDTLGIVLYQEQVMQIGRYIGNLSWGEVTALRKAMSKSLGKEHFDKYGDKWKKGAIAKGCTENLANSIWADLCAYGSWAFNKSHALAYGLISYQCCWLKAYHPFEFAAATLTHEKDPSKQLEVLREIHKEGYNYVPFDLNQSIDRWVAGKVNNEKVLIGPIGNVKGLGPKAIQTILSYRSRPTEKLPTRIQKLLAAPKTDIDSLEPIKDAFKKLLPDPALRKIYTPPTPIKDIEQKKLTYDVVVFCVFSKITRKDENSIDAIEKRGYKIKNNETESLNLQLKDDTGVIFGKISRWLYPRIGKDILSRGKPNKHLYVVKGKVPSNLNFKMISIEHIRHIGEI